MAIENVTLVRSIYDAFARRDLAAALAALDPDVVWVEPDLEGLPVAGAHHGREAVASGVFAAGADTWDAFRIEPQELIGAGEAVIVLGAFRGAGPGGPLEAPFAHVWRVRAGLATEFRNYTDTAAFQVALGLSHTPAGA